MDDRHERKKTRKQENKKKERQKEIKQERKIAKQKRHAKKKERKKEGQKERKGLGQTCDLRPGTWSWDLGPKDTGRADDVWDTYPGPLLIVARQVFRR